MNDSRENLTGSSLQFDLNQQIEQLKEEAAWAQTGRTAKTLAKYADFRMVLTVMKAGKRLEEHKAEGRLSIHTLTGALKLRLGGEAVNVPAGHVIALDRALPHDVEALEDSAFLITIAWPHVQGS